MGQHGMHRDDIVISLQKKGIRPTQTRRHVLELFELTQAPLSAVEIVHILKEKIPTLNKTTIYRELEVLVGESVLVEIFFGDRKKRYELAHREHHHHLICSQCHSVQDIHFEDHLSREEERIMNETGFQIQNHVLEFFGICKECQYG